MGIQELYRNYPILKEINKKSKSQLENQVRFKILQEGEYLKGSVCPGLIFIIKGRIKIEKIDIEGRQTHLYEIGQGELCHESLSCHLKCEPLDIVGYALVEMEIAILPSEFVQSYLLADNEFIKYMYRNLYGKFKLIIGHKESIIHQSIEERLLNYLHQQMSRVIYATHQEIALELGSSREVISRKLKQLEKEGHIELGRGKIKIKALNREE